MKQDMNLSRHTYLYQLNGYSILDQMYLFEPL